MIRKKRIEKELKTQERLLDGFMKELTLLPEGTLNIVRRKTCTEIFHRIDGRKTRIYESSKTERQYIKILQENINFLKACLEKYHDYDAHEINEELPTNHKTKAWDFDGIPATTQLELEKATRGQQQKYWMKTESAPYRPEGLTVATGLGFNVRSKSEALIANILHKNDLDFEYEPEVEINGIVYHPDFVITAATGERIIWEHFGMVDNFQYATGISQKVKNYIMAGYELGKTLLFTSESSDSILDIELVDALAKLIKEHFAA